MNTLQMNENLWKIADDLASELHNIGTDISEFGKVVAFMRRYQKADNTIEHFLLLLQRLANSNDAFSRSNKTPEYFIKISKYCRKHLKDISSVNEIMLILGWCKRLMYYYEEEPKRAIEEQRPQQQKQTQKQPQMQSSFLKKETEKPKIKVGDKVNATVLKKAIPKVTVKLHTDDKEELVFQTGWFQKNVGDEVKVKVQTIDTDGKVKKITPS